MAAQDASAEHVAVYRRIADHLARIADDTSDIGPHLHIRRHLAEYAALGGVLDDRHLSAAFLPWEKGNRVRGLLGLPVQETEERKTLIAWTRIEPFLGDSDHRSRVSSLHLALHVAQDGRGVATDPRSALRPLECRWRVTGNVLARLPAGTRTAVAFLDAWARIVATTGDVRGRLRLWDAVAGTPIGPPIPCFTNAVEVLAPLVLNGRLLVAVAGRDPTIRLWDPANGATVRTITHGHTDWVTEMALLTSEEAGQGAARLVSGDGAGAVRLHPLDGPSDNGQGRSGWQAHAGEVTGIAVLPGAVVQGGQNAAGPVLATTGADGYLRLWDSATGDLLHEVPGERPDVGNRVPAQPLVLAVLPRLGATPLLAVGGDNGIQLWSGDAAGLEPLPGSRAPVHALAACPADDDRTLLLAADRDGVRLWDPVGGNPVIHVTTGHHGTAKRVTTVRQPGTGAVLAVSLGADQTLRVWDPLRSGTAAANGASAKAEPGIGDTAEPSDDAPAETSACALLPDGGGPLAVCVHPSGALRFWRPAGRSGIRRSTGTEGSGCETTAVYAVSGARPLLMVADAERRVWTFDTSASRVWTNPLTGVTPPRTRVAAMAAFTGADGAVHLATAGTDPTVRIWNAKSGTLLCTLPPRHSTGVLAMAVCPDTFGRILLATAGFDGDILLWAPATGSLVGSRPRAHRGQISALTALTDAEGHTVLASGGADRCVRLWNPLDGTELGTPLTGHDGRINAMAALPMPGRQPLLATAGDDCSIRIWDTTSHDCVLHIVTGAPIRTLAACSRRDGDSTAPLILAGGKAGYLCFSLRPTVL